MSTVAFPDPLDGWAAGTSCPPSGPCQGSIEATTDGGARWSTQYSTSLQLSGLGSYGTRLAWAVGQSEACQTGQGACRYSVLLSGPAPAGWHVSLVTSARVTDVHFTSGSDGLVSLAECSTSASALPPASCPGRLMATTDGGGRWTDALDTDGPVLALSSAGATQWAASEPRPADLGAAEAAGRSLVIELWSSVRGAAWLVRGQVNIPSVWDPGTQAALSFSDELNGYLSVMQRSSCAMHGCGVANLYHTEDGGRSWDQVAIPDYGLACGPQSIDFAVAPGGTAYAAQSVNLATCQRYETLLSGSDGSGSWQRLRGFALSGIDSMAWPEAADGWAATGAAVIHSTDGGRSWSQVFPPPSPEVGLSVSGGLLLGTGTAADGGAVMTSPNGREWTVVGSVSGLAEEVTASGGRLWVASEDPDTGQWSLLTDAGGSDWRRVNAPLGDPGALEAIMALAVSGNRLAMVVGPGAGQVTTPSLPPVKLLESFDGGVSWIEGGPLYDQPMVDSVSLSGPEAGWELQGSDDDESGGTLWATADEAKTWKSLGALPAQLGWKAEVVDAVTARIGFVLCGRRSGYSLLATTSGGRSWRLLDLPKSFAAAVVAEGSEPRLAFIDGLHGWMDAGGAIWHTADGGLSWSPETA